jgi:hypothetical protein
MKTNRGIQHGYKSGFEEEIAAQLEKLGIDCKYESVKLPYTKPVTKHVYSPDFHLPNLIVVESKGRFTLEDRKKHILIRDQYPDMDLRILFQNPNGKINKGSKTTYGMWCDKHNIKWAKRGPKGDPIPKEWLDE